MIIVDENVRELSVDMEVNDLTLAYMDCGFAFICSDGKLFAIEKEI